MFGGTAQIVLKGSSSGSDETVDGGHDGKLTSDMTVIVTAALPGQHSNHVLHRETLAQATPLFYGGIRF